VDADSRRIGIAAVAVLPAITQYGLSEEVMGVVRNNNILVYNVSCKSVVK
jgi:hypothetical protein